MLALITYQDTVENLHTPELYFAESAESHISGVPRRRTARRKSYGGVPIGWSTGRSTAKSHRASKKPSCRWQSCRQSPTSMGLIGWRPRQRRTSSEEQVEQLRQSVSVLQFLAAAGDPVGYEQQMGFVRRMIHDFNTCQLSEISE